MQVMVVGAYGLIGTYVTARLHADGHAIIGAGRDVTDARRRTPAVAWTSVDVATCSVEHWTSLLRDVGGVVNCAGALQDSPRDDLQAVHVDGLDRLLKGCAATGVARFIHVSAAGLDDHRTTAFNRTKLAAEAVIHTTPIEWVILRPGLVLAPAAYGGSALLRGIAASPYLVPVVCPRSVVQVVAVTDVASAVAGALAPHAPARLTVDLVHAERLDIRTLVAALRAWLGLPDARFVILPFALAKVVSRFCDGLAFLGWRSPLRTTTLVQLCAGIEGDASAAERVLGLKLRSLGEMLTAWPAGVQERWFAKLYGMKPMLLAALFLFWFFSGTIGLLVSRHAAESVLTVAGVPRGLAALTVIAGAIVDLVLAAAVCVRRSAVQALQGMLIVSALYLAGGTLLRPDLWLDPLGPWLKTLPSAMLALAALALMDER